MAEGRLHSVTAENSHDKFVFEEIVINERNSLLEHAEDHAVRAKFWHVYSGDIVVDVGAGFGVYTLCALTRGAKFVYAFENNPMIMRCLRVNLHNNEEKLRARERCSTSSWRVDDNVRSVDKYLENLSFPAPRISWIKIDTGDVATNIQVLHGARKTIARDHPSVLIKAPHENIAGLSEYGSIVVNELDGHGLAIFEKAKRG